MLSMLHAGFTDLRTPRRLLACAAALSLGAMGCLGDVGTTCNRSQKVNPPIPYTEGKVENGVYMSSTWDGELLYFPGGMRYEIEHKLGTAPRWWQAYLSFDAHGTNATDAGTVAQAAGNQAEVPEINDKTLTILNASCSEYWLLVVAGSEGSSAP